MRETTMTTLAEMTTGELRSLKGYVTDGIRHLDRTMNSERTSRKEQLQMRESHRDLVLFRNAVDDELARRGA
jgi:hypothetical protein